MYAQYLATRAYTSTRIVSTGLSDICARRARSLTPQLSRIPATYFVRVEGTRHPRYSQDALMQSMTKAMESTQLRRYLTNRFGGLKDGVKVVVMKCIAEGSRSDPRLHYTSRVFDSKTGRLLGGLHTFGRRSMSKPSFCPWWKHGSNNKWRRTMFWNLSDIREIY